MTEDRTSPLPDHHKQWFEQLKLAAINGDLALMSCLDAETKEHRSVICIAQEADGGVGFTPLGHMATTDNPFDAYIPPEGGEEDDG